jgi:hypothetical protein
MVRRGPASVYRRKSSSKRLSRIALTGSAPRRACRIMIRLFGYPVLPSTDAAADRRVGEAFGLSVSGHGLSTVT